MPFHVTADYAPPRSWDQFEELCADVFQSAFGDPALVRHGRAGQRQHGVDIIARSGAIYPIGLQCKKRARWPVKKITKAEINAEVAEALKFRPALSAYYILTTALDDTALQAHVAAVNARHEAKGLFHVVLLGWGEIVRRSTLDPNVADKHFGPAGGRAPRSPLLATWMMSGGLLELTGQELELSVAELAQDLRDWPAGHFVVRQRESDKLVEELKDFERPGLSAAQRRRRIELREQLRRLTDAEARAVQGVRLMLADPDISSWLLKVWEPAEVPLSVAAFINGHIDVGRISTRMSTYLRMAPANAPDRRCSAPLTDDEVSSISQFKKKRLLEYGKTLTNSVGELPDAVRARTAVPRIIRAIQEFMSEDRLTWDQIRAMGALDIGFWTVELA